MPTPPAYKRVLLKLSGEVLSGAQGYGVERDTLLGVAEEISEVRSLGVELAIVVGGGNIFRGLEGVTRGVDRASADYMGMLATVINGLALQDALESVGVFTRVMSAIEMQQLCEPYIRRRAIRHLEKGRVVIFAAGIGNPYFTTDTTSALRGIETGADVIMKATKVDGVYDKDPKTHSDAKMFETIDYMTVLSRNLNVMDSTAISLCMENDIPIIVFNIREKGNLKRVICGEPIGTTVTRAEETGAEND